MSPPVITESGYTKFNLSYPLVMANDTVTEVDESTSALRGVVAGLVVPHIICTAFILARTWSRLVVLRRWFFDDTLIITAWACATAVCLIYTAASQTHPSSQTTTTIPPTSTPPATPAHLYSSSLLYQLTLLLTKLSILAFYHRIFSTPPALPQPPLPPPSPPRAHFRKSTLPLTFTSLLTTGTPKPPSTPLYFPPPPTTPLPPNSSSSPAREKRLIRLSTPLLLLATLPLLILSLLQCTPSPGLFFNRPM
ncbi:hypothetical protein C8A05DRAFT_39038, partial [Staphylotrichum tortipilum]